MAQISNWKFEHFGVQNGLVSDEIRDLIQDTDGYIWIATNEGLNRYNGHSFKKYIHNPNDEHSISSGGIICLKEDNNGYIWMGTFNGILNRYDKNTGLFDKYDIKGNELERDYPIVNIEIENDSISWLCLERGIACLNSNTGKSKIYIPSRTNPEITNVMYDVGNDNAINRLNSDEIFFASRFGLLVFNKQTKKFTKNPYYKKHHFAQRIYFENDSLVWITLDYGNLLKINLIDSTSVFYKFDDKSKHLLPTNFLKKKSKNEYWEGLWEFGPAIFNSKTGKHYLFSELPDIFKTHPWDMCTSMLKTKDGSIWFGTYKGLFYIKEKATKFKHYYLDKPNINYSKFYFVSDLLELKNENRYLAIVNIYEVPKIIDKFTGKVIKECTFSSEVKKKYDKIYFYKALEDKKGNIWLTSRSGLFQLNRNNYEIEFPKINSKIDFSKHSLHHIISDADDNIYISCYNPLGLIVINSKKDSTRLISEPFKTLKLMTISDIKYIDNEKIMVFVPSGPYVFNNRSKQLKEILPESKKILLPRVWLQSGTVIGNDIWIGYGGFGIYIIEDWQGEANIINIRKENGISSNRVYEFEKDNHGRIWASTGKGLDLIDPKTMKVINISQRDGLLTDDLGVFWGSGLKRFRNDDIYISGHSFFTVFNPDSVLAKSNYDVNLAFDDFKVNGVKRTLKKTLNSIGQVNLKYYENSFSISFANLAFSNVSTNKFVYRLIDMENSWQKQNGNEVNFVKVPPGKYTFELSIENETGINNKIRSLIININPAWWQTWRFKLLFILVNLGFLIFLYLKRIEYIKEKERVKAQLSEKLLDTEMRMLQSQMNSHFLFNTLNSIKIFIIKNEKRLAADYLSDFAQLIRNVLNNSKSQLITLESEISTLELYLKLEILRFEDKFDFSINIDDSIDIEETKVPPLLLQPFVENAIWHGLLHKDSKGEIDISIINQNGDLQYIVTDNGIGRQKAEEMKSKSALKEKTYGLRLSSERLGTLKKICDFNIAMKIIDLYNENKKPSGTKVIIRFTRKEKSSFNKK